MAMLKTVSKDIIVPDGSRTLEPAEELGIIFGCHAGNCGTCKVQVLAGMENLGPKTLEEEEMFLLPTERLMCQCTIKSGTVIIKQGGYEHE